MTLNLLDFLLLLILLLGLLWGMTRGLVKVIIGLASLYVGLVISLFFYQPLAGFFLDLAPGLSMSASQAIAFGLLLLVFVNGLSLATGLLGTPPAERMRRGKTDLNEILDREGRRYVMGPLNQLGGLLIGFVVTAMWLSLGLGVLQFVLRASVGAPYAGGGLPHQLSTSQLVPIFNYGLSLVYGAVAFWLPQGAGAPAVFSTIIQP